MPPRAIRIGTRKSALAMAQAKQVADAMNINGNYELVPIVSSGDKIDGPLRNHGGKSLFTKELDLALLQGDIDLAIHSMKDVETPLADGLEIAAVPLRADPRDVLITNSNVQLDNLQKIITIGTSSLRRERQLTMHYPNFSILPCRGNIQTRLQKYANGEFDGIILALAGLVRMGLYSNGCIEGVTANVQLLDAGLYIPAPGQGALAIMKRCDDHRFDQALQEINHPDSLLAIQIERQIIDALNLTCNDPVGVYVLITGNEFHVNCVLFNDQGAIEQTVHGLLTERDALVHGVVEGLN
ncbi:MAG: hydroxymethylbilane synthase [Alphaproteobacteria bacterium]